MPYGTAATATDRRPRRGRPRDEASDVRIREAVVAELADVPYARVTIESIARRAGVARSTVYRRYPTKLELVVEIIDGETSRLIPESTGDLEGDVRAFVQGFVDKLANGKLGCALMNLDAAAYQDSDIATFVGRDMSTKRLTVRRLFERARDEGRLRPGVDIDLVTDVLIAVVPYRLRVTGATHGPDFAAQMTALALFGVLADDADRDRPRAESGGCR